MSRPGETWPRVPAMLALPLVVLVLVAWLEWQPFARLLRSATSEPDGRPSALGLVLMFGSLAAGQAGRGRRARPYHLVLAAGLALAVLVAVAGLVVDQYPCWQGVPNCD